MSGGSVGEGLGGDHDSHPDQNPQGDFHGNDTKNSPGQSQEAEHGNDHPVKGGVANPCAHPLPARVSDVDGGGEGTAKKSCHQRGEPVDGEGGPGGVAIPGGFGAFQILEGSDDIEECHGKDDGEERAHPFPLEKGDELVPRGKRQMKPNRNGNCFRRLGSQSQFAENQGQEGSQQNSQQAGGKMTRKAYLSRINKDHEKHGEKGDGGLGVDFKNKRHGDEGEGDAGERGKQGGARKPTPEGIGDEGAQEFQKTPGPTGENPGCPDEIGVMGLLPEGAHDEKQVGDQANGIDSEGQGGDIVPAGALGELVGLPGVEKISDENG